MFAASGLPVTKEEKSTALKRSVTCLRTAPQLYPERTIGYELVSLTAWKYSCGGQRSGRVNDEIRINKWISRRRKSSVRLLCVDG